MGPRSGRPARVWPAAGAFVAWGLCAREPVRVRAKLTRAQVVRMAATGAFRAMRRRGWWVNDTFTCAGQAFFIVDPRTGLPRGSIVQRTHTPGQGTGESTGAPA